MHDVRKNSKSEARKVCFLSTKFHFLWQFFLSNISLGRRVISMEKNKDFEFSRNDRAWRVWLQNSVKNSLISMLQGTNFSVAALRCCLAFTLYLTMTPWSLNQDGIFGWHASFTFLYYKLTRKYFNGIKWPFSNHILNHFWY